ncbi:MAG: helix-turn-helix domain-containing protein [Burkholderiales bacterium]|nr:helix-turn-helix domain-containing protein [Opitutaceae bacterium]
MPLNTPNQSLQRAMRILFAVGGASDGRSIEQIARRVGLKPNTAGRFVRTMELEKLLVRREGPLRFLIGPAVAELKHLDDTRQLLDVAGRVLVRTQVELVSANFSLAEPEGADSTTRLTVMAARPGVAVLHRAQLHRPYRKASSMLFLAYGTEEGRERFFQKYPFSRDGAALWGTRKRLEVFFEEVVRKGYAQPDFPDEDYYRVAAPVFAPDGRVVAAVGGYFGLEQGPRNRRRLVALTVEAARRITEELR